MSDVTTSSKPANSLSATAQEATDQASQVVDKVSQDAKGLGDQATSLMRNAQDSITESAKGLMSNATDKLKSTIDDGKSAGADRGHSLAEAVRRAADQLDGEIPQAAIYVRKAADQIDEVADAIRRRDVGELLGNVQSLARSQPTAFLAATVLAGFAVVRLLKTSAPSSSAPTPNTNPAKFQARSAPTMGQGRPGFRPGTASSSRDLS